MLWSNTALILSLLGLSTTVAQSNATQIKPNLLYEKGVRPHKYQNWFPNFGDRINAVSIGVCNVSLNAYLGNLTARESLSTDVIEYCSNHNDCILSNLVESIKADISTAGVILGLTPGILASLGPSVAEISVLSTQRPLLSLMLSLGAPAVYPARLLRYDDPLKVLHTRQTPSVFLALQRRYAAAISIVQYVIAAAAIANVFYCATTLGLWTISTWDCNDFFLPLLWVLLCLAAHGPAAIAFRLTKGSRLVELLKKPYSKGSTAAWLTHAVRKEFQPCASGYSLKAEHFKPSILAIILNLFAGILAYAQVVYGIIVFSSLLYISVGDASFVVARFIASALACQIILTFELSGLEDNLSSGEETRIKRSGELSMRNL